MLDLGWVTFLGDFDGDKIVIFGVGGVIAIVAILAGTLSSITKTRARERSRREIAAYIAEGSMTPEQGERLMEAASKDDD